MALFIIISSVILAGCTERLPQNTPSATQENQIAQTVSLIKNHESYSSKKYGFSLQYPTEFEFKEDTELAFGGVFFSKGKDDSHLFIFPQGEYDTDGPTGDFTKTTAAIDGKMFQVREWKLANNQVLRIYNSMEVMSGWTVCDKILMNCNRIEVVATDKQDLETVQKMLLSWKWDVQP